MTPKQIIEWIGDKAINAAALLWVALETMFDFCVLLPIQMLLDFVSGIVVTVFDLDNDNEHCEEDWKAGPEGNNGDSK